MDIVTRTTQKIIKLGKLWQVTFLLLAEHSSPRVSKVGKTLHCPLQNLNIQQSRRYVAKYHLCPWFYCLWEFLLNIPLLCMLIMLKLYSYQRIHQHPNVQNIYTYITTLSVTTLRMGQCRFKLSVQKKTWQIHLQIT